MTKNIISRVLILFVTLTLILTAEVFADEHQDPLHSISFQFENNMFTDFASYSAIHTGLTLEYSYPVASFQIDSGSGIDLNGGFKTGLMFEAGADFPRSIHLQTFPIYIPLLPLVSVSYQIGFFEIEAKFSGGGEMVIYENISPYIQILVMPELDLTYNFTEDIAAEIGLGWGWSGVINIWSGPSMSLGCVVSF